VAKVGCKGVVELAWQSYVLQLMPGSHLSMIGGLDNGMFDAKMIAKRCCFFH
jgi:hypothetical protein